MNDDDDSDNDSDNDIEQTILLFGAVVVVGENADAVRIGDSIIEVEVEVDNDIINNNTDIICISSVISEMADARNLI